MRHISTLVFVLISSVCFGQVAFSDQVGNPVPDNSAILDLQSTDRGFLPPRMTTAERNAISNPASGLVIFNTTTGCFQGYLPIQGWSDLMCDCQNPPSPAFTSPGTITQYSPASFSATTPGLTYSWNFQGGTPSSSNSQNPSVTWSNHGSFLVSLVVTDALGCSDSMGMMVTIDPCTPPSSAFTNPGSGSVNVAVAFSANAAGQNYAWTFQSGSPATSTSQSPSITWTATGTYNITLIVSDANGCADTSTGTITISSCVSGGSQTFNYTGSAVPFVIPNACGAITIEAWGAQGGDNNNTTGGLGARMRGEFNSLTPGDTLWIIVGQEGFFDAASSGGGGGSGVVTNTGSPLVIAGGGGGVNSNGWANKHGTTSNNGLDGQSNGGSGGSAGSDGSGWIYSGSNFAYGGRGFNSGNFGSTGQNGVSSNTTTTNGTFGLGGGGGSVGSGYCNCGGGGGGYSGGGSGNINASGGGGGSFNAGTNQSNSSAIRSGNGQVVISW